MKSALPPLREAQIILVVILEIPARLWHSDFVIVVLCRTRCLEHTRGAPYCSLLYEPKEQGLGDFFNLPRAERFLEKVVRSSYTPAFPLFILIQYEACG